MKELFELINLMCYTWPATAFTRKREVKKGIKHESVSTQNTNQGGKEKVRH